MKGERACDQGDKTFVTKGDARNLVPMKKCDPWLLAANVAEGLADVDADEEA